MGEFTDFVHPEINCFIRQLVLEEAVSFMLSTDEKTKVVHNKKRFDQYDVEEAFLFTIEAGAPIYNTYPSIASTSFQVILKGENIHINQHHIDHAWSITIGAGESFIYVMGGPSYPECMKLPSREDGAITVGYDYGLLLYALTKLKHPMAEEFYVKTLSVIDPTGAWVEYYENGMPKSTRYRPFESAINIEALIQYSLS